MDPLSSLAIAAAVFQFLDIGGKLLVKGWGYYKNMRGELRKETPDYGQLNDEKRELLRAFEDLSSQISGIQATSENMMASELATPANGQSLRLLSTCTSLSRDLEKIKKKINPPSKEKINCKDHLRYHPHGEESCKECQKRNDAEIMEFNRNEKNIEEIRRRLEALRRNVIDSVILGLWDDSKRTKQWEVHFSNKLDKVVGLLERTEKLEEDFHPQSTSSNQEASIQDQIHHLVDEDVARLRKALRPLIQTGKGPLSLKQLAKDIIGSLDLEVGASIAVRKELIDFLRTNDWKLDISMTDESLVKINPTTVGRAIASDIRFNTIQSREEAISDTSETTYSWIFEDEPQKVHDIPMWNSFPKWFEDDSNKVYWITGKPGSGKSTIMKLILQQKSFWDTQTQSSGPLRLLLVKYYAWNPGNTLQKSLEGLKRTILSQVLDQCPDLASVLTPRRWAFCQVLRSTSGIPANIKLALFIDGLDEFDMQPTEIIKFIRHITAQCQSGLKVCAASRPWTEFEDEFNEGPMLQMHLLTERDMRIFVTESFKNNKGFIEQKQLNAGAATQLLTDIVQRANGVFIWVSIVVQHLLALLLQGQSISQARQTLKALPSDISSLYDIMWASISPKNLFDASYMMQVLNAAEGPLPWFTMWLIEESRFASVNINDLPDDDSWKDVAIKSLKRKLAARTKCILEINADTSGGFVDFIHRTARDWAMQPENWQLICSSSAEFDPHLCILKAETLIVSHQGLGEQGDFWDTVARALWHASEVKDSPKNTLDFVNSLNSFNAQVDRLFQTTSTGWAMVGKYANHWSAGQDNKHRWRIQNTFLGLAAQFSILPYIKAVTRSDRRRLAQTFSRDSLGLLENAIFGYSFYMPLALSKNGFRPRIPCGRRLATVEYLLEQGVHQSTVHARDGRHDIKEEIQNILQDDTSQDVLEYYSTVKTHLDNRDFRASAKTMGLRIRYFFKGEKHS
ncbi:AAA domain-containing protein [Trichoderma breve]|uniref:AAA domain-containing protein n=1 Tax=Trichoderma breve TaxID=2034170 RepID=A0A9W9B2D8_9HYPO|nr:AAA domain-containing protein [Trichoderma breve]KAJ4854378.1 AAA domain-containing protein [Trichoderma breve]